MGAEVDHTTLIRPFLSRDARARFTDIEPGTKKVDPANHGYDLEDFYVAVNAGNFPAVTFLKPAGYQNGHAGYSDPLDEQEFLVHVSTSCSSGRRRRRRRTCGW